MLPLCNVTGNITWQRVMLPLQSNVSCSCNNVTTPCNVTTNWTLTGIPSVNSIRIGSEDIGGTVSAKNIGAVIDRHLTMHAQVSSVCRNCYLGLRQINEIRTFLTEEAAATLVNCLVTSKLDNLNALLYGLPNYQIKRLQLVQNNAARIVSRARKCDNITPVLKKLHWLPVSVRIEFKILLLCFNSLQGIAPSY